MNLSILLARLGRCCVKLHRGIVFSPILHFEKTPTQLCQTNISVKRYIKTFTNIRKWTLVWKTAGLTSFQKPQLSIGAFFCIYYVIYTVFSCFEKLFLCFTQFVDGGSWYISWLSSFNISVIWINTARGIDSASLKPEFTIQVHDELIIILRCMEISIQH